MKHLFSSLKSYRKEAVLSPLFKLLEASLELVVPLVVAQIVDRGIATGDRGYVVKMCLLLVLFGVVGLAFSLTAQFFAAKAAVGAGATLRERLFEKLQSFSYTQIDETGTVTMINRMTSDVNQVQTGINMTLRLFLRSPFVVFGAMIMAFVVDWQAGLVFVAVIPLLSLVVFAVMAACIPLYKKVQEKLDKVYLSTRENLAGVRVLRAFCKEESEKELFDARNGELAKAQKRAGRIAALTNPFTYVLVNLAVIALVYVGALRVHAGALEQGDVIALYGYLSQILVELIKLANLIVTMTKAVSSQKRIGAVLDQEGEKDAPSLPEEQGCGEYAVTFEGVDFAYAGGGENALTGASFRVKRGQTVGVIGGTGSGKSTLVNLIPRFYTASAGRVTLCGVDVNDIPAAILRERVAVVPQKSVLFQGTIRSNLLWGRGDASEEELHKALEIAQAEDVVAAKGGLDGAVAQEGKNLSGGQRQRLCIARALVRNPEVLVLDDSSSALDFATDLKLRKALKKLDTTVFLVSQRTSSVKNADMILVLDDGKIVAEGTHGELLEHCPLYREIHESQYKEGATREKRA